MKSATLIILIALLFNLNSFSQKVKPVPIKVRKAFEQKFPGITKTIWDNSKKKYWEAEFRMDSYEYSVTFDLQGKCINTEHEISKSEIPSKVKTTISKEFEGYKIVESWISESTIANTYVLGLIKEKDKTRVTLDINGKILKKASGNGLVDMDENDDKIEMEDDDLN